MFIMLASCEALLDSSYYYFHTSCTAVSRRLVDTCPYWRPSFFVSGKVQRGTCRFRDSSARAPRSETRRIHDLDRRRHEGIVQSLHPRVTKFRWSSWTHQNRKQALFIPEPVYSSECTHTRVSTCGIVVAECMKSARYCKGTRLG